MWAPISFCGKTGVETTLTYENFSFAFYSDEGDEIVECDNCGITVHEGNSVMSGCN